MKINKNILIILIILVPIISFLAYLAFKTDDFSLPKGEESESQKIVIADGQIIGTEDEVQKMTPEELNNKTDSEEFDFEIKEIMITDGVKHSVPLNKIIGGGPAKDGIPSIDDPKFVSVGEASDWLDDAEAGIGVEINGINRFYPFLILVWHEIVNDTIDGQRILVTYCPLCLSGIVFDPLVDGERVEFGTSGKLWNSNLVMYDRKTDSLWSQILGEAIVGEMTGTMLKILPSDQMRFGEWKKLHPASQVLSKNTDAVKFYGQDPYGDYYTNPGTFFEVDNQDDRLEQKDFVLGIVIGDKTKAYLPKAIKKIGRLEDNFAGKTLIIEYKKDIDAVQIFEKKSDGNLERINPFPNFWFSWVAVHPDTELYK